MTIKSKMRSSAEIMMLADRKSTQPTGDQMTRVDNIADQKLRSRRHEEATIFVCDDDRLVMTIDEETTFVCRHFESAMMSVDCESRSCFTNSLLASSSRSLMLLLDVAVVGMKLGMAAAALFATSLLPTDTLLDVGCEVMKLAVIDWTIEHS